MSPKTKSESPAQAGFIAKKDDFPSLSPSLGVSASGSARDLRFDRLEEVTADLSRSVSSLFEGQQLLSRNIGEFIQGFNNASSSSASRSFPAPAPEPETTQQTPAVAQQQQHHRVAAEQQLSFVDFRRFTDVIASGFESTLPSPSAPLRPHLFTLENDHTFRQLSSSKFKGALEEYQLLVCYGFFLSCTVQAQNELAEALRAHGHEDFARQAETCLNSAAAVEQAVRQRVHYIRLAKGQAKLSPSDQMFAEHLRTAFQPSTTHLGCPNTAALHEYFKSKELECSLAAAAKAAAGKKYSSTSAPPPSATGKSAFQKDKNFKHKSKKGKEAESADEA